MATPLVLRLPAAAQRHVVAARGVVRRPRVWLPASARTLVVVAHPDDESVMCGGTIARLAAAGSRVTVLVLTHGEASVAVAGDVAGFVAARQRDLQTACDLLGVADLRLGHLPDGGLAGARQRARATVAAAVEATTPDLVVTHDHRDGHPDHEAVADVVAELGAVPGRLVLHGEVWRPLADPDLAVDVTTTMAAKRAAVAAHVTAGRALGLDRAVGLSAYRGFQFLAGRGDVECFRVAAGR